MELCYPIYMGSLMMMPSVPNILKSLKTKLVSLSMTLLSMCCRNRTKSCGRAQTVMIAFLSG